MISGKIRRIIYAGDRWFYLNNLKSSKNLILPHFLGLGPGQSGSTWLFEQLSRHPDIFIPPKKELNYFNRNIHRYSLERYAAHFKESGNLIRGDISPGYSVLRGDRIKFLRLVMPKVRLVLTVRNPVERSWSSARRLMERFKINFEDFDDYELRKYLSIEWAYQLQTGEKAIGDYEPGLLEGQYSRIIDHWSNYFPREQLLVVFFKQMVEAPETYLNNICAHIGATSEFKWDPDELRTKINPNPIRQIPNRIREILEELYENEITWLKQQYGEHVI